jgi:hypothetical protein
MDSQHDTFSAPSWVSHLPAGPSCNLQGFLIIMGFHTFILCLLKRNYVNFSFFSDTLKKHIFLWLCHVKKWKV